MYYFGLGCAYDEAGSTKNAKIAFYDAINIDPMNIQARIAYAISLTKELEYAQSIEQFNNVLKYFDLTDKTQKKSITELQIALIKAKKR